MNARRTALAALLATASLVAFASPASAARTSASPVRVVAVGDIACPAGRVATADKCRHSQVADRVASIKPNQLWLAGDLQYDNGERKNFDQSFNASWGRFRHIWRPVPGNHEYNTPGATGYYGYFGAAAGAPDKGYYSFQAGNWHIVALNSNCTFVACDDGSQQVRWLRQDLRVNSSRCVAAIWHHPLYSSGAHGANPSVIPLWRELRKARAEFVVSGHDHDLEAFQPQDENGVVRPRTGIRQFVSGAGGRSFYTSNARVANSGGLVDSRFGVLSLTLGRTGYLWRFVAEDGSTLAAGRGPCR